MMVLTVQQVKDYIGLDYEDEMVTRNIERIINVADKMFVGSLGKDYPSDDERVQEMALMICEDLYTNRGMSEKVSSNTRRLFKDFMLQVRMEMRK